MAEIVPVPTDQTGGGLGAAWSSLWNILANWWWLILLFGIIIGLVVVAFVIWMQKEENDKRRDSATYATAMDFLESAEKNAKQDWIRCRWSFKNLFWLGLPFLHVEHSLKLKDIDRNHIGWYRGHVRTQDGDSVFLVYRNRSWLGLKENKFLLYCSKSVIMPKEVDGKIVKETFELPNDMITIDKAGNEIKIKANTILRLGNYYYFPNYVFQGKDGERHLDLTSHISNQIAKINHVRSIENAYGDFSRAVGKAVEVNPMLRYGQKEPEKEKEVGEEPRD